MSTIRDYANSNASGYGVDPGLLTGAMTLVNGGLPPDQPLSSAPKMPTMAQLAEFMSTGTIASPSSFSFSTPIIIGGALIVAWIITKH